ncbi:hypothetical protein BgAZ_401790 [Babesia gibsoni]|uniref:Mediator of RNA polymerase II transcription subunit 10 n=1 Tax=Babesia gibsoni TaxID=33632 RepID=A0AAD8LJT5_BABGI|nr:hypothetical protein BgAZ_401790 [Babesia gibsoni]
MKDNEDSSSNDEAPAEEASSAPDKNARKELASLLLEVVERLTKISVICESRAAVESSTLKSLMKHIHKFEKNIRKLQALSQTPPGDGDHVFKGAVRAVDNYMNPYDWAYSSILKKYEETGNKLDHALDSVDLLQRELIERLQVNKLLESANKTAEIDAMAVDETG